MALPDDGNELGHGEFVRHQELGLVQRWKKLLALVAFDDDLRGGEWVKMMRERLVVNRRGQEAGGVTPTGTPTFTTVKP